MAALKAIVVIMGLMILAGLTLLGAIIAGRLAHRPAATSASSTPAFVAPGIDLPAGAAIERMTIAGDRLVLDMALPDGNRQLLLIDLATGRRLGTIPLHMTAPSTPR